MTAHALVTITLKDPETFAKYRELAGPALAKHKAKPLVVSKESKIIEGDGPAPDVAVILEFPDRAHAEAWINDPELTEVHALRNAGGNSRIVLM